MSLGEVNDHLGTVGCTTDDVRSPNYIEGASRNAREVLGKNIKLARKLRNWSQEALALEAGLDRTFVAHVERSARNISIDNIERLAWALQCPIWALLNEEFHRVAGAG